MSTDDEREQLQAQVARAIKEQRDSWPLHLDLIAFKAKVARARFKALRSEGFSVDEALRLCVEDWKL